ncbi:MAG: hypothetical protein J6R99_01590 [Alphaproteobacteria bacterium]|nr:hypothetical protein [Alphaproteobacteria bacterium]
MERKCGFLGFFVSIFITLFSFNAMAADYVCENGYMRVDGVCTAPEFTVTTTELTAEDVFWFYISAAGTYYIDWGDDSAVEKIEKTNTNNENITHTYATAGVRTIKFYGQADAYSTKLASQYSPSTVAAISFANNARVAGIDGSLGAIFGTLDGDVQPSFYQTFYDNKNMKGSLPNNLFKGRYGQPAPGQFLQTVYRCEKLSGTFPDGMFADWLANL